jgi:AcrR family transcriptional regulator
MNEHSFIINDIMARITDLKRIERLKQSTMKLVVEKGFGGASAILIAKDAGVAAGYFYRHYKGKKEMVNSLLQDVYQEMFTKFQELSLKGLTFSAITENMIRNFIELANANPVKIKFLYVLTHDYSFVVDPSIKENIFHLLIQLKNLGHESGELDKEINEDDLYQILIMNVLQTINLGFRKQKGKNSFKNPATEHLVYLTGKVLR